MKEKIIDQGLIEEMENCYLDYAMSVIVQRALPDVRDGFKPVHRRILYAMWNLGLKSTAKFRKSATVVGEVLGKYHPHGDSAVYESMVRMAQDFTMRYLLVNGQGNFGSMDGDGAAAMRYTEVKMKPIAEEALRDIEKNTVDFVPNYDGTQKEPKVMPAELPNLLLNGVSGIAVGMATNIPPHNLGELCDAIAYLANDPDCEIEDLVKFVPGPDFPTGGIIYNINDIKSAYATGKGRIICRAKTEIIEEKEGRFQIIINEVPYQVNKATLLEKIAALVKEKRLEGIRDIRDESDKDGVRVVIELKKEAFPQKVLNRLFKLTTLQTSFNVNMLALVDGIQPRVLNLKEVLEYYLKHRKEVVRRRTQFELEKAEARAHILEGLQIAIDNIDAVIKLIKKSKDREEAKNSLMQKFKLSEIQSIAILEMRLQNLANLERLRIEAELKEKKSLIKELKEILGSDKKILKIITDSVSALKEKYGDERRTKIVAGEVGEFKQEDLVPNEPTIIFLTRDGYIKRMPPETFKTQARGGKGVIGLTTKEEDIVDTLLTTQTHDDLLFFTTKGRVFQLKAYEVPVGSRTAKGSSLVNFLQLSQVEKVSTILPLNSDTADAKFLFMATTGGTIKKTNLEDFTNVRRSGLIAIKLKDDERLKWVHPTNGNHELQLVSSRGQSIRFREKDVRPMGRTAAGVRGIKLKPEDFVVALTKLEPKLEKELQTVVVTEKGYGKRSQLAYYKVQNRGGSGIRTQKVSVKTGKVVRGFMINKDDASALDLMVISEKGQLIRIPLESVPVLGRDTQGVHIMRFKNPDDKVASVTLVGKSVE
ncbi:DNA gyrase subunit A [Candidatus Falkowbacteria bacterium RIFOXYD2_FULL_35_9]|uniref:DNA gyrase subunit A n=1 Tax=Candidatus Falkowbacteria bacterium RIFOXYC2_FULL_36_12 TaxID=1798002 RepID=A0A1F5T3J1_9BACT|nr:MAG: DNA gyrase subunit A [Candidatus Falkowbacteria bacterium RIFOXYB2_FULL_35_7]OGF33534.1 MAG: DNA gyrase subunit A [Candidatus Falkowbacteria bacterium RIFOXYC2_FULL_36_12]OGF33981.1 MAG: DNA gyrase subunit A [Candidatus Falkowbacteria bacterium RIFOXYA2_FULL_35_8]OGF48527.1 MAG: DNA gyrase subunit A [Candidatus Falkowbacteria bacterium RIFOXYD2_FULL_35_9]